MVLIPIHHGEGIDYESGTLIPSTTTLHRSHDGYRGQKWRMRGTATTTIITSRGSRHLPWMGGLFSLQNAPGMKRAGEGQPW